MRLIFVYVALLAFLKQFEAKMIELDWSTRSSLFDNGYHTITIFARINDLLRFRCSSDLPFQIKLMKPLDALNCQVRSESSQLVGFCGPNTSDPRLALRPFALVPNQPTFQTGEVYYFVAVGNNSRHAFSSELCDTYGMRLRLHVMAKNADIVLDRVEEETTKLLIREQQKADAELVRAYNRNIQLEQQKIAIAYGHQDVLSHEDNQSIRDKPSRQNEDYDHSGRGRINSVHHNRQHYRGGSNAESSDNNIHFRPISSSNDPYSLPSRTIGYDYVIGYEDTNSSSVNKVTSWFIFSTLLLSLIRRI